MKKQNIAIIAVIALVLAVSVGYALFSQTLTITGTAKASGNLDIRFTSVGEITNMQGYTKSSDTAIAVITEDEAGNTPVAEGDTKGGYGLKVTVDKLDYPGAYVEIPVTITNKGSIPAKLISIAETGAAKTSDTIKVSYSGVGASDTEFAPNASQTMIIR